MVSWTEVPSLVDVSWVDFFKSESVERARNGWLSNVVRRRSRSLVQCCRASQRRARPRPPARELSGEKWTPSRFPPPAFHLSLPRTLRRVHFGSNHISLVEGHRQRGKTFPIEAFCKRRAAWAGRGTFNCSGVGVAGIRMQNFLKDLILSRFVRDRSVK